MACRPLFRRSVCLFILIALWPFTFFKHGYDGYHEASLVNSCALGDDIAVSKASGFASCPWNNSRLIIRIAGGKGYFSSRINYHSRSVSGFHLIRLFISGDVCLNPGPDKGGNCDQVATRNHGCLSAPCRTSSMYSMAGHNKPRSIQPAGAMQGTTRNHGGLSAPCKISSIYSMAGKNKPHPRSGGVNFNNLTSVQPAGAIQTLRSDLIRFALWNIRSIRKKAMFLKDYVVENQIDLLAIRETWLDLNNQQTSNIINGLCPLGFAFMHIPRMNNCGGGVGLLYNKCHKIEKQDVASFVSFEYLEVLLRTPATAFRIGVLYGPPPSTENGFTASMFFNEFPILLERLAVASGHLLLTGDFNFHVDDRIDSLASRFLDLLDSHNLIQHVSDPTHKDNHTLDLMITRACDDIIESWSTLNPQLSDHSAIHSKLALARPRPLKVK